MSDVNITLRGITWEHPRGYDSQMGTTEAYRAVAPGVSIEWEQRSLLSFGDADVAQLAADYDLLVVDHPHIAHAASSGVLHPLRGTGHDDELAELAAHSVGASHASYEYGGQQWATAIDAAAQVAAFRPDLATSVPHTWVEVLELARDGRVLWPAKPVDAFSSFVSVAAALDFPLMSDGVFIGVDDALTVLELLHRLAELTPERGRSMNPIDVAEELVEGDHYLYSPLLFGYTNYSRAGFRRAPLAFTDAPEGPTGVPGSMLGGAGLAVSASTAHPAAAIGYAVWAAGGVAQRGAYFDAGGQPAHSAAWDDSRLNSLTLDFFSATRRTLDAATVRPQATRYPRFQNEVGPLINAAVRGEVNDRTLVTWINNLGAQLLHDNGRYDRETAV